MNTKRKWQRWKEKYNCSLGEKAGWCDGHNQKRCPSYLGTGKKNDDNAGCLIAI